MHVMLFHTVCGLFNVKIRRTLRYNNKFRVLLACPFIEVFQASHFKRTARWVIQWSHLAQPKTVLTTFCIFRTRKCCTYRKVFNYTSPFFLLCPLPKKKLQNSLQSYSGTDYHWWSKFDSARGFAAQRPINCLESVIKEAVLFRLATVAIFEIDD